MRVLKSSATKRLSLSKVSKRHGSQVNGNLGEFETQLLKSTKEDVKYLFEFLRWSKDVRCDNLKIEGIVNQLESKINEEKGNKEDLLNFLEEDLLNLRSIEHQVNNLLKELPEELPTIVSHTYSIDFWFRGLTVLTVALITFILATYLFKKYFMDGKKI